MPYREANALLLGAIYYFCVDAFYKVLSRGPLYWQYPGNNHRTFTYLDESTSAKKKKNPILHLNDGTVNRQAEAKAKNNTEGRDRLLRASLALFFVAARAEQKWGLLTCTSVRDLIMIRRAILLSKAR